MGEEDPDFDLYEDVFQPVNLGLKKENGAESTRVEREAGLLSYSSGAELESLRDMASKLTSQNMALKKNISCLYKTAQQELQRKESIIERLMKRIKRLEFKAKSTESQSTHSALCSVDLSHPTSPKSFEEIHVEDTRDKSSVTCQEVQTNMKVDHSTQLDKKQKERPRRSQKHLPSKSEIPQRSPLKRHTSSVRVSRRRGDDLSKDGHSAQDCLIRRTQSSSSSRTIMSKRQTEMRIEKKTNYSSSTVGRHSPLNFDKENRLTDSLIRHARKRKRTPSPPSGRHSHRDRLPVRAKHTKRNSPHYSELTVESISDLEEKDDWLSVSDGDWCEVNNVYSEERELILRTERNSRAAEVEIVAVEGDTMTTKSDKVKELNPRCKSNDTPSSDLEEGEISDSESEPDLPKEDSNSIQETINTSSKVESIRLRNSPKPCSSEYRPNQHHKHSQRSRHPSREPTKRSNTHTRSESRLDERQQRQRSRHSREERVRHCSNSKRVVT